MQQHHVQRWREVGYISVKWGDLFANEKVIASVKDSKGKPVQLPLGSKLMMACVVPCDEDTKIASELVHDYQKKRQVLSENKARFFIGLANYHDNDDVDEHYKLPVGTQDPLNSRSEYSHMRPSLTSAEGRQFGDIATPLWIDAWQMDTVGIQADPRDGKRKPVYMNALFHKFNGAPNGDTTFHGQGLDKGLSGKLHLQKYFEPDKYLKLEILYEYVTVPRPFNVQTGWGDTKIPT